jgi:hypothetical protein
VYLAETTAGYSLAAAWENSRPRVLLCGLLFWEKEASSEHDGAFKPLQYDKTGVYLGS